MPHPGTAADAHEWGRRGPEAFLGSTFGRPKHVNWPTTHCCVDRHDLPLRLRCHVFSCLSLMLQSRKVALTLLTLPHYYRRTSLYQCTTQHTLAMFSVLHPYLPFRPLRQTSQQELRLAVHIPGLFKWHSVVSIQWMHTTYSQIHIVPL